MSDKRPVVLALFLLFLLLAGASPARASEPVGTVTVANGRCVILRGGQSLDAAVNQPVMLKDEVDTDKGAELSILFSDQSRLTLDESSHAAIDTYVFNDSNAEVLFKFTKGTFRAVTGEIVKANPEGFNMETPLATLGIRGSDVYSIVKPDEEEAGALELGEGHALEIKTSKQTMRITKSGMRTRILPTGVIFMPTAIPPSMFNAILRLGASAPSAPAPTGNTAPAQSRSSSEAPAPAPAQTRSSSEPQAPTTFAAPVDTAPTAPAPMLKTAPTGTTTVAPTLKTPVTTTTPTVRTPVTTTPTVKTPVTTTPTVKTPVTTTPTLKTPVVQPVITPTAPTVKTPVVEPKPTVRPRIRQ
ncbi:FecR domain-containing protein [Pseudodesulfovibrio indicus]|uniref:FecR domain-containing protein n=1 Tax=Pseudodesulfovibrio indicus TaxID=1716143 RepID=UPI00292D9C15|nr:FecR domain-containing protein [Pseudodesulfovibrio indicus]